MNSFVEDILSSINDSLFPLTRESIRNTISSMISFQLKDIDSLSELERQRLKEVCIRKFFEASILEHEPVGVNAALTVGENLTQSSLQSHHHAGLKRGAIGFDRIEEITNMSNRSDIVKVITTPHILLGKEIPRTEREIFELSNLLVEILIDDITSDYTILSEEKPSWLFLQCRIFGLPVPTGKKWMRVFFDTGRIFTTRISLPVIANAIKMQLPDIDVFYPPIQVGSFVDIYLPVEENEVFFSKLSTIMSIQVGGIAGVKNAIPIPENLLTNLSVNKIGENEYLLNSSAPVYVPSFCWENMLSAMIPDIEFVSKFHFRSSYSLDQVQKMILQIPLIYADIIETAGEVDPSNFQEEIYLFEGKSRGDRLLAKKKVWRITFKEELASTYPYLEYANLSPRYFFNPQEAEPLLFDVMVKKHFFWYIEVNCSNIANLYLLPEIDSTKTVTTSPLDCRDTIGYLAMRNMIYNEFRENIHVNPIHVKLIINNMTLYRDPVSIKRQSLGKDKSEWLTYTTFEDILNYFPLAAFAGEIDNLDSVSAQVLTGKQIEIGRGGSNLPPKSKENPTGNRYVAKKLKPPQLQKRKGKKISKSSPEK